MINIEELQEEILHENNINRLYEIQIDLSKLIKNAHAQNIMAETIMEQSEAKGNLGIYHSMLDILQKRINETLYNKKNENNNQNRINYNFRLASKKVLKKETYKKIIELANMNRPDFKKIANQLHKIE